MSEVRATNLRMFTAAGAGDVLADGAFVLHTSIQREWVYAKVLTEGGQFRTRRYRHGQMVQVQDGYDYDPGGNSLDAEVARVVAS